ncbi:MAG: DNA mismatch repair endonuclease MutL [Rikenellaceae bacterium]|nr:DNA mismatch repair endonuclease MutL [Rikenellaceae bacterium]
MKIRLLPDSVANQIAAGEVVGNASSVVKEMAENAVDAGASLVTINFRADGRELVQVTDNGEGMTPADARLAFDKHATSKITSIEDIYRLSTFGFRGEALASIAAVAEVELTTRTENEELGCRIVMRGGEFVSQEQVVAPKGTTFKVRNLFFNVPARRKFIEDSEREAAKIKTEFTRVALCHPEVAFMLYKDDAPLYNLPVAPLKGRIAGLMGKSIAAQLLEVGTTTSIVKVEGFVGRPESAKKRNKEQYLFVNGRFFKSPYLHKAVLAAYDKLIPAGVFPSYFLYLTVDTDKVDVNVHPQKTEVKFSEDSEIWQIVNAAVRESLAKTGAVPMMDFEDEGEVEIPVYGSANGRQLREPASTINPYYNPFTAKPRQSSEGDGGGSVGSRSGALSGGFGAGIDDFMSPYPSSAESELEREFDSSIMEFIEGGEAVSEESQQELALDQTADYFRGAVPLVGGYVATSLGGRLAIVDLARAREVLMFRRYISMLKGDVSVGQALLFPERMVLSADDVELMRAQSDKFAAFGFEFAVVDQNTIEFSSLPADIDRGAVEDLVYDMLDSLRDGLGVSDRVRKERLAAILSKSCGVKRLSEGEVEAVLDSLEGCKDCSLTYDGRPVVRLIEPNEIKTMF